MSELSSLQAELNRQQAINRELRGELMELGAGVAAAHQEMSSYKNRVENALSESNNRIQNSHNNIIAAHEIQLEIDKMYVRFKNMELANKKIRACNNKKYYDFANYATVRKIVQGMLDNLNLHMISDAVIYKSIEKKHLQTPDYWLTPVLLAIMAWKNDDRPLADRAIAKAVELDKKNSAIFMMLFNIRMGRNQAALKWFMVYQECELKGSDQETFLMLFSLLNKTIQDDVEDNIKYEIIDFINRVIAMNAQAAGYDEQQILDTIEHYLERMKDGDKLETKMLKRCLVDYADMADIVSSAENNMHILQFLMDVANVSEQERNSYLEQFIMTEISKPNQAENDVYEEIAYNELIISCNGDIDRADKVYEEQKKKRENSLDLISEMIAWVYGRTSDEEVSGQMRKNMFTLTQALHEKGIRQYVDHYRQRVRNTHPAVLGDYTTEINFNNRSGETEKITNFYEAAKSEQLKQIKYVTAIVGVAIAVGGVALAVPMSPFCLILSGVGAALAVFNVLSNNKQKKHIEETCVLNIKSKNEIMDGIFGEYGVYRQTFAEYDAYYERIEATLNQM